MLTKTPQADMSIIKELLINGIKENEQRCVLANSLFYYCCGKDITPISAFGDQCCFFVYADIVGYGDGDFTEETSALYNRLNDEGFSCQSRNAISGQGRLAAFANVEITQWQTPSSNVFYLAYIQGDAYTVFRKVYSDGDNYIQPRCVCNYRNEFFDGVNSLAPIEKRAEFLLGHCHSHKYRLIDEVRYSGDYGGKKVPLYQRIYWYVY